MTPSGRRHNADALIAEKLDEIETSLEELRHLLEHRHRHAAARRRALAGIALRVRSIRLSYEQAIDASGGTVRSTDAGQRPR